MFEQNGHEIKSVVPDSIADQLGIVPGDRLISIDGKVIEDILDYRLLINTEKLLLLVVKEDGEEWEYDIENDYEDLGLEFGDGLMSEYKRCTNSCIFCFIDQMPKGMRDTLYFKDDDSRLSFLQGNYVTLTNMNDHDVDRIINYRLSPINISVHTTNPELRCKMLRNKFAGDSLKYLDRLYEAGISMNGQIVMCPGYNDGAELERTISDLMKYAPVMESVSVVPIGQTKYRDGLTQIPMVDKAKAAETIDIVEKYQAMAMKEYDIHFIHASDEFYLLAGRELPSEDTYDGYLQYENGVGMLTLFIEEARDAISELKDDNELRMCTANKSHAPKGSYELRADANTCDNREVSACKGTGINIDLDTSAEKCADTDAGKSTDASGCIGADVTLHHVSVVTGRLAGPSIRMICDEIEKKLSDTKIDVYEIRNDFFGEKITVSGLITGQDIIAQLKGKDLGSKLLLPRNMFRSGEETFLDDLTREDVERELGVCVEITECSGYDFVNGVKDE